MRNELQFSVSKLSDAIRKLQDGVTEAKDELTRDGVIQRFEFTFELLWKSLKVFLEEEGVICKTPKECLKSAFRIGLIEDEGTFLNMLEDRNKTSQIYSREESEEIFQRIKENYLPQLSKILDKLKKK